MLDQFLCWNAGLLAYVSRNLPDNTQSESPTYTGRENRGRIWGNFAPENRPKCRFFVYQNDTFSQNRMGKYMAKNEKCGKYR